MVTAAALGVSLETGCAWDVCRQFARPLFEQMASGRYDECAVQPVPDSLEEWELAHKTARKRTMRALRRGYYVTQFDRSDYADDIYEINMSKPERQGRPMSSGYTQRQVFTPLPTYDCDRHRIRSWGVFAPSRKLVGYLMLYRAGDLVLVSQILGHAAYEPDEIMFPLFALALAFEVGNPGVVVYNRWDSGGVGLRQFKRWLGFEPVAVEWLP